MRAGFRRGSLALPEKLTTLTCLTSLSLCNIGSLWCPWESLPLPSSLRHLCLVEDAVPLASRLRQLAPGPAAGPPTAAPPAQLALESVYTHMPAWMLPLSAGLKVLHLQPHRELALPGQGTSPLGDPQLLAALTALTGLRELRLDVRHCNARANQPHNLAPLLAALPSGVTSLQVVGAPLVRLSDDMRQQAALHTLHLGATSSPASDAAGWPPALEHLSACRRLELPALWPSCLQWHGVGVLARMPALRVVVMSRTVQGAGWPLPAAELALEKINKQRKAVGWQPVTVVAADLTAHGAMPPFPLMAPRLQLPPCTLLPNPQINDISPSDASHC